MTKVKEITTELYIQHKFTFCIIYSEKKQQNTMRVPPPLGEVPNIHRSLLLPTDVLRLSQPLGNVALTYSCKNKTKTSVNGYRNNKTYSPE